MSATFSQPFTITITVTPVASSISLSATNLNVLGTADANAIIGVVSVTTNPPGGALSGPLWLSGADAAKFALTNGGVMPCNLTIGPADIPAGSYSIALNA
jgi:hypothetical protein